MRSARSSSLCAREPAGSYFDEALQRWIADQLQARLQPGGFLVLGTHEALPREATGFRLVSPTRCWVIRFS